MIYQMYFSPTGGTKKVSDIVCKVWECPKKTIDLMKQEDLKEAGNLTAVDICIAAVPSFGGRVPEPVKDMFKSIRGNGAKAVLIAVYGNRAFDDTLLELKDMLENADFTCIGAIAAVAEHSILRQFGTGRPDIEDEKELREYAGRIKDALDSGKGFASLLVPGNYPYREYHGVPFKPEAGRKCNRCGICIKQCPAQAISAQNPKRTDKEKCISCLHCISVCPQKARKNKKLLLFMAGRGMKKKCEGRKENNLFYKMK